MVMDLKSEINVFATNASKLHIAVLGDLMIDRYIHGKVSRISPEAPVPVVNLKSVSNHLGGAANVLSNLVSLGVRCSAYGMVGSDENGKILKRMIEELGVYSSVILEDTAKPSTVKTRIMDGGHQLLRVDEESDSDLTNQMEEQLIQEMKQSFLADKPDFLIIEDYNKGLLTPQVIKEMCELCYQLHIPVAVDPKKKNFFMYKNVQLFKPNLKEASEAVGLSHIDINNIQSIGNKIIEEISCSCLMITLAGDGIFLQDEHGADIFSTKDRKVSDVSGAGDTVISLAAICKALSLSSKAMALICNTGGGQVCEASGVVPVNKSKLLKELDEILD